MPAVGGMLGAGSLNEQVTLQSPQTVRDAIGGESPPTWTDVDVVFAAIDAVTGREANVASQIEAVTSLSVVIRPRTDVLSTWRVLWGARVLSIEAVLPSPRKDRITLLCSEGLNQSDQ